MKKNVLILMFLTLISQIIGFIREITLSYYYGASHISDAYLISLTIPQTIYAFIGAGITTSYIPLYSSILAKENIRLANRFTNNIINFVLVFSTFIVFFVLIFSVPLTKLFASGFDEDTLKIAVDFTRISIFGVYFSGLIFVFTGYLQMKNKFIATGLMNIPLNLCIIFSIIMSATFSQSLLSIGSVLALLVQFLCIIPVINNTGYRYRFIIDIHDKHIKKLFYLSLPAIAGVSINQINILINQTIASHLEIGGISTLSYASRLNASIQGIFVVSIITALYPMISRMAAENNLRALKRYVKESINVINLFVLPVSLGSMVFAKPIVQIIFARGAFDQKAIQMTSQSLFFFSIGMVAFGLREILARVFLALQDSKTPMINAILSLTINIILNFILSAFLGIGGLSLATSLSAIICTILLFISLKKKVGSFGMREITSSFIKMLVASIIMAIVCFFVFNLLNDLINYNLSFLISVMIGVILYFTLVIFMKVTVLNEIVYLIKKRLRN